MDVFRDMASDTGEPLFCGGFLDIALVQFCFMKLIQVLLITVKHLLFAWPYFREAIPND